MMAEPKPCPKYVKRPIPVEAFQWFPAEHAPWDLSKVPDWLVAAADAGRFRRNNFTWELRTMEGVMAVPVGAWIIRGVRGELYACDADIFAETYEPLEDRDDD